MKTIFQETSIKKMLTKDQVFSIQEFIYSHSAEKLWEVGDKLTEIAPELYSTDSQKQTVSRFIVKNGRRIVKEIESSIYSLFKDLATPEPVQEEAVLA